MTDNEKLDLLLAGMQEMKTEIQEMKIEIREMNTEIQEMKTEVQDTRKDIRDLTKRVARLEVGQAEIKRELYKVNRKISDTYNLSLDALGMSAENREWLESGTLNA